MFTDTDLAELATAYRDGATTRAPAERYDVGETKVVELLNQTGVPLRHQGLSPEQATTAAELYEDGQSVAQVAAAMTLNTSSVYDALVRAGVSMRPVHEAGRRSPTDPSNPASAANHTDVS